ncbi:MAG: 3'-5' exonuclease [Bacteriovoracaceae bacterium]|nr:3'-5' exonuclease [Bacteriovoracaceae bacterium]
MKNNTKTNNELPVTEQIKNLSFCVFDLETTGGNHEKDKIIEIGLIKIENLEIVAQKNFLIQPEIKIPEFIQKLTSIGPKEVKNARLIEDVIDDILDFMGDSILVAHNTSFDIPFFNSVLKRLGKPHLTNRNICTNLMTKHLIPNLLNSNLNYMSRIFGIKHKQAHRALDDAKATANLLLKYLHIFIKKNITKINHLYYPRNRYELDLLNLKSNNEKKNLEKSLSSFKCPFLITLKGQNGVILFALPCHHSKKEISFIIEKAAKLPWKTATIKLYGSLMESIIHFNNHFSKIENDLRNEIIQFFWKEHLRHYKMPDTPASDGPGLDKSTIEISDKKFGDFIVMGHLVPEQFIVYPIKSLHQKSSLIFRYPGHQKKLMQHLKARSVKIQNNKHQKVPFSPPLRKFVTHFLINARENDRSIFIFNKGKILRKENEFLEEFEKFCSNHLTSFNFPAEYV